MDCAVIATGSAVKLGNLALKDQSFRGKIRIPRSGHDD